MIRFVTGVRGFRVCWVHTVGFLRATAGLVESHLERVLAMPRDEGDGEQKQMA